MKHFLSILALLALCIGINAADFSTVTIGTNTVASTTEYVVSNALDFTEQEYASLYISFKTTDATNTQPITLRFKEGVSGNTGAWPDAIKYTLTYTPNGTTVAKFTTNFTVAGFNYLQLYSISNSATAGLITNFTLEYSGKKLKGK